MSDKETDNIRKALELSRAGRLENVFKEIDNNKQNKEKLEIIEREIKLFTDQVHILKYELSHIKWILNRNFSKEVNEVTRFVWLSLCLNTRRDPDVEHYLVLRGIDREEEVKNCIVKRGSKNKMTSVLQSCNIDSFFLDQPQKIYLKVIADWYLRRYNGKMARQILKPFDCWDKLKLFYPRLLVAIIIGLLALMTGQEGWNFPHKLFPDTLGLWSLLSVFSLNIGLFAITVLYLTYECYNIISDKKKASKRALNVGVKGYVMSFLLSLTSCAVVGRISVDPTFAAQYYSLLVGEFSLNNIVPVLKNTFFFSSAALFIGIFIQVFWEKETITEPL
ncbi:MAG: hypothetical protein VST71_05630 [Nitrospirota bacterium]|nr:hypothetical protein [Nitrospirota bacterium]